MNDQATLRAQLVMLANQCRGANATLVALRTEADGLLEQVGRSLAENVNELAGKIEEVRKRQAAAQAPPSEGWEQLSELRAQTQEVFGEYLALAEGAWARRRGVDDGMCSLADALIDELNGRLRLGWDRFTIPAESEFFGHLAQVVRVRVPTAGLWDLPVVAHELGHFAAERLEETVREGYVSRVVTPLRDVLDEAAGEGEGEWAFAHEYIADAFATYTLGPAYAYACILLRFEPTSAQESDYEHPADAARVELMLGVLQRMDEAGIGMTKFDPRTSALRALWGQMVDGVAPGAPGPDAGPGPNGAGDREPPPTQKLFELLRRTRPSGGYATFHRAQALAPKLAAAAPAAPPPAQIPNDTTIADVVNAAWLARVDAWEDGETSAERIRRSATKLCEQLFSDRPR